MVVLDIDNTLFDWVNYYAHAFTQLLATLEAITGIPQQTLATEAKSVFSEEGSIEYPFVIQRLPSIVNHYQQNWQALINEAVRRGRDAFISAAGTMLKPYADVPATLAQVRATWPQVPLVALTDAPRYVAMWKLNKLGLLSYFDAVYGLADPELPVSPDHKKILVDEEILLKHHLKENFGFAGKIRTLPDEYEKPGVRGLKTVLMDYEEALGNVAPDKVLWIGDNLAKDVLLGHRLGVKTAWARYGTAIPQAAKARLLNFSPDSNVRKNVALDPQGPDSPQADFVFDQFQDILATMSAAEAADA